MIGFRRLKPGDMIGIAAPASPVDSGELEEGIRYFQKRGFRARVGRAVFSKKLFLAGSDQERADDIMDFFTDPEIKAIFTAGGGYGTMRLLDLLDYKLIRENPKIFMGFSDTTALQLALLAKSDLVTYSGITLVNDLKEGRLDPLIEISLGKVFSGETCFFHNLPIKNPADFQGRLIGGCLSLIVSLLGTDYFPGMDGAILLMEDVREEPYRVDRMLTQLRLAGVFKKISAIVLGEFLNCPAKDPADGTIEDVIDELTKMAHVPVIRGIGYGHGPARHILPIGGRVSFCSKSREFRVNL